jgi:hypothetical protein
LLNWIKVIFVFLVILASASVEARSYNSILKKWTRHDDLYQRDDFYASLVWKATLLNDAVLQAQIEKIAKIYDHDNVKIAEAQAEQNKKFAGQVGFYVNMYTYNFKSADLNDPRNEWLVQMEVNGEKYRSEKIEKLGKLTPMYQKLYPYSDIWSRQYLVYFEKPQNFDEATQVRLSLNGPEAKGILAWKMVH